MPQIIVMADCPAKDGAAQVMFRERVTEQDFESGHFAAQLLQRIEWAVGDAHDVERRATRQRPHVDRDRSVMDVSTSRPRPVAVPS